jgi:DNA-binding CsgD family transcriptional regulator
MLDDRDLTSERFILGATLGAFALMAGLAVFDLVADFREGTTLAHAFSEGAILLLGCVGAALVTHKLIRTVRLAGRSAAQAHALSEQLRETTAEAARWRSRARELVEGLARAMDEQFDRWDLSPAEKEVALLLLKGLSHREIAAVRSVTEATARQQARSVYRKAGLQGRHDLSAFFLEDLMVSSEPEPARRGKP